MIEILFVIVVLLVVLICYLVSSINKKNNQLRSYLQRMHRPWAQRVAKMVIRECANPDRHIWKDHELVEFVYTILTCRDTHKDVIWARVRISTTKVTIVVEEPTFSLSIDRKAMVYALRDELEAKGFQTTTRTAPKPKESEMWIK